MPDTPSFQTLLYESRMAARLTLRQVARAAETAPSYLNEMEHGKKLPPRDMQLVSRLARVLGVDEALFVASARAYRLERRIQAVREQEQMAQAS